MLLCTIKLQICKSSATVAIGSIQDASTWKLIVIDYQLGIQIGRYVCNPILKLSSLSKWTDFGAIYSIYLHPMMVGSILVNPHLENTNILPSESLSIFSNWTAPSFPTLVLRESMNEGICSCLAVEFHRSRTFLPSKLVSCSIIGWIM